MMGGGIFDYDFPYNVYGAQPRRGFYQPRASDYGQFWYPSPMRQPAPPNDSRGEGERAKARARNVEEIPVRRNVRTVVVEDGGAKQAESREAPPQAPQSQKAPVVRFENSDAAATKIQAVYRGYYVRRTEPLKHLRVICKVKAELQELMRKSCRPEEMEKVRDDPQVRLRWAEGVMALILRLDSLQGVHPAVRDIRKSVAKELICFQERIDSMADAAKEKLVVDNVDFVEEDSNVGAENEDLKIAEDLNVPESEIEKLNVLEMSDSSAVSVPEESTKALSSLSKKMDIGDHLQGDSVESSIPEAEAPIQIISEKCQESDVSVDSQENLTMSTVQEDLSFAAESSSMVADTSEEVACGSLVEGSNMERVPAEVSSGVDVEVDNHKGPSHVKDIALDEDEKEVVACQVADGNVMKRMDMGVLPSEGISGMDLDLDNKGSPQLEGGEKGVKEEAVARQNLEIATVSPTAQTFIAQNLHESLMSGDNNAEVANATEPTECTCSPAGELENAADGYTVDVSTIRTKDQELSTPPVDASNDAIVVATQPSCNSLITEPHQGDSLQTTPTTTDDSRLSDRALMLQILEDNRKLKSVVGEVLQWGKQQNEAINNLASRVKELEGGFSNAKLLKNCTHSSRKRAGSIAGPKGERERVVRRLENGRNGRWGNGRQVSYIKQWPTSAESEEFF